MAKSNVTDINDAPKGKAKGRAKGGKGSEEAESPFEAYQAEALQLNATDYLISACDGEQTYVWLATKRHRRKVFKVIEFYPGLEKKKTDIREASDAADLELDGTWQTLEELVEDLTDIVFEGINTDDCDDGACPTE